ILPATPFGLLGKFTFAAKPIEEKGVFRLAVEEPRIQTPKLLKCLIVEFELLLGIEGRDRRRQLVERIGMAARHAIELLAQRFDLARVAGNASTSIAPA